MQADGRFNVIAGGSDKLVQNPTLLLPASGPISSADGVGEFSPRGVRHLGVHMRLPGCGRDMVTRAGVGNISGEATTPAGNICLEAMRGVHVRCRPLCADDAWGHIGGAPRQKVNLALL